MGIFESECKSFTNFWFHKGSFVNDMLIKQDLSEFAVRVDKQLAHTEFQM